MKPPRRFLVLALVLSACSTPPHYDVIICGGTVYDGTGERGRVGDVALRGDRIAAVGEIGAATATRVVDAHGMAVAPGFINMLSWATKTLLVDPLTGDLYLISRDRDADAGRPGFAHVFRCPAPQEAGVKKTLVLVARFAAPHQIKGGDISPDGKSILLRAHSFKRRTDALLWTWDRNKSLAEILREPGTKVPAAKERQGEAIGFSEDGLGYYTIGEGLHAPLYRYELPGRDP